MNIQGIVTQILYKSKPFQRKIKVQDEFGNSIWIEARGKSRKKVKDIKTNDFVAIEFQTRAYEKNGKTYTKNLIKKVEALATKS